MNRTSIKDPVFRKSGSINKGSLHCLSGSWLEALHALELCLALGTIFIRAAPVYAFFVIIDNSHLALIQLDLPSVNTPYDRGTGCQPIAAIRTAIDLP